MMEPTVVVQLSGSRQVNGINTEADDVGGLAIVGQCVHRFLLS